MSDQKDVLVGDSGSSHTILKDKRYVISLTLNSANISTIAGISSLIEGHGQATVMLPMGTQLEISNALFSPSSMRSLLSFKDIRMTGLHVETLDEENKEFLQIYELVQGHKKTLERIPALSTGLYHTKICMVEANATSKTTIDQFTLWHDRLGHPGSTMMRKLISNTSGHELKDKRIIPKHLTCSSCSMRSELQSLCN